MTKGLMNKTLVKELFPQQVVSYRKSYLVKSSEE